MRGLQPLVAINHSHSGSGYQLPPNVEVLESCIEHTGLFSKNHKGRDLDSPIADTSLAVGNEL